VFKSAFRYLYQNFHLSLIAFYFFIPTSILSVPIMFWTEGLPASIGELLLIGVLITALTFSIYWILISMTRSINHRNLLAIGFAILLGTGIARGVAIFSIFDLLGFQNPTSLTWRIFNSIFNTFIWLGLGSVVIESNRRFTRRYRALMTQILVLKLREESEPHHGFHYIAQQILQMQMRIKGTVEKIKFSSLGLQSEQILATTLRREVEEELRPLSQRLWVKSIFDPPAVRIGFSVITAIRELKIRFTLIAFIYFLIISLNISLLAGPSVAITYGALTYLFFAMFNELRKELNRRFSFSDARMNFAFVVFIGFAVNLGSTFMLDLLGLSHSYSAAVLIAPTLTALIVTASFIELALSDRETLLEILSCHIQAQDSDYLERVSRGNAASYVHNSLQSELTSLAFHLDSIAANPDPIQSKLVMEKVESFISRSKSEDFSNFLETPELRLQKVLKSWEGIADIGVSLNELIYADQIRASLMVQLIEESVANAVRGGRANKIAVSAVFSGDSLRIIVRDNGIAPMKSIGDGLGSKWIDSVSLSYWTLEETESGRILTVEI
jgi:hypothetical protein